MAIPDAQLAGPALAGIGAQAQAGQQLGQHRVGIGRIAADEGAHADAVAPLAGEGPAEAVAHQAEFKTRGAGLAHRTLHLHRHRVGKAGPGGPEAMAGRQRGSGAVGDHHRPRLERQGCAGGPDRLQLPVIARALQALHRHTRLEVRPGRCGLLHQVGIEHRPAHDPEGSIAGQHGRHGVAQAPGEAHLLDHRVHRRPQVEGEQALHRGRHAAATGLGAREAGPIQQHHLQAPLSQVEGGGAASGPGPHHGHIGWGGAHTLRMSASFSARCFSSSAMNLSVSFCTLSCSSRL